MGSGYERGGDSLIKTMKVQGGWRKKKKTPVTKLLRLRKIIEQSLWESEYDSGEPALRNQIN